MGYQEDFIERTKQHIKRVNKYASNIGKSYPMHDSDKFTDLFDGYSLMKKENPTQEEINAIDKATFIHVTSNPHHCEYWSLTPIHGFTRTNCTPHGPLDVRLMTEDAMFEMCCDWCAMSEEYGNTPYEWLKKVCPSRWIFTQEQLDFIYNLLGKLWEEE